MTGHRAPFWSAALFTMTVLACAFGAAYALDRPRAAAADEAPINAVYFTTGHTAALPPPAARAHGIAPVTTFAALRDRAATADAIVIDREMLPQVPSRWLAEQHRREVLIMGINIPSLDLARHAEYEGRVGGYLQSYGGRAFYSYFYQRRVCGGNRGGSGSDAIYSSESIAGLVRLKTRTVDCPPTTTGPPRYRPTPIVTATPLPRSGP